MLSTPIGRLIISVDGKSVDYYAEKRPIDKFCPDLNGRYLIEISLKPDGCEHEISCRIEEYKDFGKDEIESRVNLELKTFYHKGVRLSLGMEADTASNEGQSVLPCDYDREYLSDGVQYRTFSFTKTNIFSFGVSWLKQYTSENAVQTWIGADPSTMRFQREHPLWQKEQELRNRDKLIQLTVDYHRTLITPNYNSWAYLQERCEKFVLKRKNLSMEYYLHTQGRDMSACYTDLPQVLDVFTELEAVHFPEVQESFVDDIIPNQEIDQSFKITAVYAKEGTRIMSGRLNCYGIPMHFKSFIQGMYNIISVPAESELMNEQIYSSIPRRHSDLMFCEVMIQERCGTRTFSYLCEDNRIEPGSWVLVPFGKENRVLAGFVYDVQYAQPDNAPYPIKRIKRIVKECTQEDLVELEKEEHAVNPFAYRLPNAHYAVSSHECPLLRRRIYWGGRGGCCDVGNVFYNDKFMEHFELPFELEIAEDICRECGWREKENEYDDGL